jgi:hypothetical protein
VALAQTSAKVDVLVLRRLEKAGGLAKCEAGRKKHRDLNFD